MTRWRTAAVVCLLLTAGGMTAFVLRDSPPPAADRSAPSRPVDETDQAIRDRIYAELQPVRLTGCTLERIGEAHDGGYLMCANLLDAEAGYSYGISNYDGWGCGVSTRLGVPVHQYDCFDQRAPRCDGGTDAVPSGVHRRLVERRRQGPAIRFTCQPDRPQRRCGRDGWS